MTSQEAFEKWARDNMIGNGTNREAARLAWQASRLATQEEDCRRMCASCKTVGLSYKSVDGKFHHYIACENCPCAASPIREGEERP